MKLGDRVLTEDGTTQVVSDLLDTGEWETVYNFRIADFHTYFVGEGSWGFAVWAHNDNCSKKLGEALEDAGRAKPVGVKVESAHVVPALRNGGTYSNRTKAVQDAIQQAKQALDDVGIGINSAPNGFWATGGAVERVRAHHLRGFVFRKLWPLITQEDHPEDDAGDEDITAQSVIVQLAMGKSKPSKVEKQRVEDLMDQIDLWLLSVEREGRYLGSLEGHEYASRECRMFLGCPSADALAEWLFPKLQDTIWNGDVTLTKRYGHFDTFGERDIREERLTVR